MAELTGITPPSLDWRSSDLPTAFSNFKQYVDLIFKGPFAEKGDTDKVTYLLLWLGQEGITIYNSWEVTEAEKKDYTLILKKFENYIDPMTNFRVARYNLQKFVQVDESSDEFMTRCKIRALNSYNFLRYWPLNIRGVGRLFEKCQLCVIFKMQYFQDTMS